MTRLSGLAVLAVALIGITRGSSAAPVIYTADLSGPAESPPNASPGTGFAEVDIDPTAHTLRVQVTFSGLLGTTTASHIHAATPTPGMGTAIVATQTPSFSGFPLGVTSGTFDSGFLDTLSDSTYNPAFEVAHGGTASGAESALFMAIAAGESYLNIHTTVVPGGEIRGFLQPKVVPEPTSLVLLGGGVLGLIALGRRKTPRAGDLM